MAVSSYPRSLLSQMALPGTKLFLNRVLPLAATLLVIGLGGPIIKKGIGFFLMKLYEYFIERNALKL